MNEDLQDDNRRWWDERAARHAGTPMYRAWIDRLRAGGHVLRDVELGLAGDVAGLDLLHLQCHIGTDSLSWARLGARVTGVDVSAPALAEARRLAEELGLPLRLVHADVAHLPGELDGGFDLVVSTYGTYGWLPDLRPWAAGIARVLRPGGRFVLVDGHPLGLAFDEEASARGELVLKWPVKGGHVATTRRSGSYADPDLPTEHDVEHGWCWGIGDVVGALTGAGLLVDHLGEHDTAPWQVLGCCERVGEDWRMPEGWRDRVPLVFSVRARSAG